MTQQDYAYWQHVYQREAERIAEAIWEEYHDTAASFVDLWTRYAREQEHTISADLFYRASNAYRAIVAAQEGAAA